MDPTEAGFLAFIRQVMGISSTYLPDDSVTIPFVYNYAIGTVNLAIDCLPVNNPAQPSTYALAVYNLAGDRLLNFAQDQEDVVYKTVDGVGYGFFAYTRKALNLTGFTPGVIQSTNDLTTGGSYVVPEAFKELTIGDLSNLKTPYGQWYLSIAQDYGPSEWGIS